MNFIDEKKFQLDISITPVFNVGIITFVVLLNFFCYQTRHVINKIVLVVLAKC
jgi:hypothetical protein